MEIHGQDVSLEKRSCKKCNRPFRVLKKSKQNYCCQFCCTLDHPDMEARHRWGHESAYVIRAPKNEVLQMEDEDGTELLGLATSD